MKIKELDEEDCWAVQFTERIAKIATMSLSDEPEEVEEWWQKIAARGIVLHKFYERNELSGALHECVMEIHRSEKSKERARPGREARLAALEERLSKEKENGSVFTAS